MRKCKTTRREVLKASVAALAAVAVEQDGVADVAGEEARREDPAPRCGEIVPSCCLTRDQVRWLES